MREDRFSPEDRERLVEIVAGSTDERRDLYLRDPMFKLGVETSIVFLDVFVDGLVHSAQKAKPAPTEAQIMKGLEDQMKLHAAEGILENLEVLYQIIEDEDEERA